MQQTRFCSEISLVMLSHHQNNALSLKQPCDMARSRPIGLQKKFVSTPGQNVPFNAVIYIFVEWDALAKARRGKEKN